MNDRRPYGEDPYSRRRGEPAPYGRRSAPGDQGGQHPAPGPRRRDGGHGAPGQQPLPPRQGRPPRDQGDRPADEFGRERGMWDDDDENTRLIGKLGYVPPEVRDDQGDRFNLDRLHADDGTKVRARKRARKASPLAKLGVIGSAVLVVALIAGGIWWLSGGDDPQNQSGLAYEAIQDPCEPLDTSALDDISSGEDNGPPVTESKKIGSKTEQRCAVSLGAEAGTGVDVEVSSVVFARDAGARNEFNNLAEDSQEQSNENRVYSEVSGIGDGAFTIARPWAEDTGSADFSLHVYDGNAYMHVRVTIYSGSEITEEDVSARTTKIAEAYLTNWRS